VQIRPRTDADLDACELPATEVHRLDGYPPRLAHNLRTFLASPGALGAWIASLDGDIVGHVALHPSSSPEVMAVAQEATGAGYEQFGVVARLLVAPAARRSGVATTLLDTAVTAARQQGRLPILDVASHLSAAIGLYQQSGWTRIGAAVVSIPGDEDPLEEFVYLAPERKFLTS
jgi:GNAT superfamily N-acetyltransferase